MELDRYGGQKESASVITDLVERQVFKLRLTAACIASSVLILGVDFGGFSVDGIRDRMI